MELLWQVRGELRKSINNDELFTRYLQCLTAFLSGSLSREEMTAILGNLLTSSEAISKNCLSNMLGLHNRMLVMLIELQSQLEQRFAAQSSLTTKITQSVSSYRQPGCLRLDGHIRDEQFLREASQKQVSLQPTNQTLEQRRLLAEQHEVERVRGESLQCQANGLVLPDPSLLKDRLGVWAKSFGGAGGGGKGVFEGEAVEIVNVMYDGLEEFLQDYLEASLFNGEQEATLCWKGFPIK